SRASAYISDVLSSFYEENPSATTEQARECVIEAIRDALSIYGEHSAAMACDLFDEICEAEGISATSRIYDTVDMKTVEEKIHWAAKFHADGHPEQFEARSQDIAAYYVRRNALENVIKNCEENNVRYARVPTGFETCGFCLMLAGRGFVYHSEASAIGSHGLHNHCDCIVIPGKKGRTRIDGYNSEDIQKRFSEVSNSVRYDARKKWEALSPEERKAEGSWNDYLRRAACREVERRDTTWAWTGKVPEIDYSEKPREVYGTLINPELPLSERYQLSNIKGNDSERRDLFAHDMLMRSGMTVRTRLTIEQGGSENIDIDLMNLLCEVKSPTAVPNPNSRDELKFVQRRVQEARHQFEDRGSGHEGMRVILSNYYTGFEGEDEDRVLERFYHEVNRQGFEEAIFIRKNGEVVRVK
ncbi:MAG: hypothetical protein K5859_06030, partial [Atopobiaceae bacterium]|nr:hypothetical protein [Atopobiaceae bacterium]